MDTIKMLVLLVATVPSMLLNGWALSLLWTWFVVSAFGVPALTIGQAIGVSMTASIFTHDVTSDISDLPDGKFF